MKNLVILGGKGIGMIAAYVASCLPDVNVAGFLNDGEPKGATQGRFKKYPVLGQCDQVHKFISEKGFYAIVAYKTMKKEDEQWDKLVGMNIPPEKLLTIIHPTVKIPAGFCRIGHGVLMAPGVQLSPDTIIGDNCILLGNCFIGHDSTIERYVSIANTASIGARVHIERGAHIGSNATIRQGVTIGEFSLVGIGSVVLRDVPPKTIVAGVPARLIKPKGE